MHYAGASGTADMPHLRANRFGMQLLSAGVGLCAAYALYGSLHRPAPLGWLTSPAAKVSFRVAAPIATPEPIEVVKTNAVLPLKTDKPVAAKKPKVVKAVPSPMSKNSALVQDSVTPPPPSAPMLLTLEQPAFPTWRPGASLEGIPGVAATPPTFESAPLGPPPMPSEIPEFRSSLAAFEQPGGDIVVLALLVNEGGIVVDTRIVVPSQLGLQDLGIAYSYVGKQWVEIDPPMLPGEYRWFELRIDHILHLQRQSLLP